MSAHDELWHQRYATALRADDDREVDRIEQAWDDSYDLAADGIDEGYLPDQEWKERRARFALQLLDRR